MTNISAKLPLPVFLVRLSLWHFPCEKTFCVNFPLFSLGVSILGAFLTK